ncbi:glycosyltransferase [Algiphilus sp.]|uniref:glycosyltransferase n=1 Tax=Algiphilus sp. TaxID=1872431 RepID=UPI003B51D441
MLSLVLPTSNEAGLDYLPRILARFAGRDDVELIVVDNASGDGTRERIAEAGVPCIDLPRSNRAQRLNAGIAQARSEWVLLHHPRSLAPAEAPALLAKLPDSVRWGAFSHRFDMAHPLLAWTSWYSNHVRLDRAGIAYLDHCIFARREALLKYPVPDLDIFEDTALSRGLRARLGKPMRLPATATTSAVRYRHNGVWRQALMNQVLKLGYGARVPHVWMNRLYERGLSLNG